MSHLLHVDSSIRAIEESRSRKLSQRYADAWRASNPDGTVTYRDLSANPIPHTDATSFAANFLAPEDRSPDQAAAKTITDEIAGEVVAADTIVLGMGLYNFGVPSTVKAWFDRLVVPGVTVGEQGGLLGDKKLVLTLAAGGGYGEGTPRYGWDHRELWLRHAFEVLGLTDILVISAELTLARESPRMIPLNLGTAEDQSYAAAEARIDAELATVHA
ncbi:MAG TPA: NAD(P)H-dependent oxidoreductase [Solirubrobacteraceae bacterium]|nr:NAD(P)H-dependent oxidoreductase [Solirubrobacteraceae bacterium]